MRQRLSCLAIAACFATADALALPVGAQVVNGAASIAQTGNVLTVTNSNGAIINWQQFNIDAGQTARFVQPSASSSVLNRVLANDPSVILGNLTSNGRVWLVNPAGIFVGQGARIDAAGFVASTLNVTNADFLANRLKFDNSLGSAGNVVNQGQITTPMGGSVYLIGSNVSNEGIITTPRGETILAAGNTVELIDSATPGVKMEITGAAGNVTNLGEITAEAGRIGIAGMVVRNSGKLNASSVVEEGGRIFLRATKKIELTDTSRVGADGTAGGNITAITSENGQISGELVARGEISAQGDGQAGSGGFVETSAAKLDIDRITVRTRGGEWLLDPNDIMIQASGSDTNVSGNPNFTSTADSSIITTGTIQTALNAGTSVNITTGAGGAQTGNITVADAIAKTAGTDATLTLNAHNNINLNAGIGSTVGLLSMVFNANSDATGGGTVNFGTMTLNANGGGIGIPGIAFISSGTATLDSATTIGSLNIAGGTLTGAGNIAVATGGSFSWSNGVIAGTGTLTTQTGVVTTLTPGFAQQVALRDSRVWDNYGTVTFTPNSGTLSTFQIDDTLTGGTAVFNNKAGALFDINASFTDTHIVGVGTFNNEGELRKSLNTSAATTGFTPAFNNLAGGAVNLNSGSLRFDTGGTDAGNYALANNATLQFHGGPRSISGNIGGAGNVTFSKPLTATAVYTLTGDYNISGATTVALDALGTGNLLFNGTVSNLGSSYAQSGGVTSVSFSGMTAGAATGFQNLASIAVNSGSLVFADSTSFSGLTSLTRAGSGTLDLGNNSLSVTALNVSGGTLTGSGAVAVSTGGVFNWSNGAITGSGTLTTQSGVATTLMPGFAQQAALRDSRVWDNYGTVSFTPNAGTLSTFQIDDTLTGGTAVFNNRVGALFNINASFTDTHIVGVGNFNNEGELRKSLNTTAASSGFAPTFNNQSGGIVNVNSGTLNLAGSNTYNNGSAINIASGATLQLSGGTHGFLGNAAISGSGGSVLFSGGTINTASTNDFALLNGNAWSVAGGTVNLLASNVTDFTGAVSLTGGTLNLNTGNDHSFNAGLTMGNASFNATDNVTIPLGQVLTMSGAGTLTGSGALNTNGTTNLGTSGVWLNAKTWNNNGVLNLNGASSVNIAMQNNAVLNNNATGSINIQAGVYTAPLNNATGSNTINNYGTITKDVGSPASSSITAAFNNLSGGVVAVNSGTLVLSATNTYTNGSTINVGSGATLQFSAGTHGFTGNAAIAGIGGSLLFSGGTNTFNAGTNLDFDAAVTFSGGTTTFDTGATKTNTGTVTLTGGTLTGSDNFVFNNLTWTSGNIFGTDSSTMTTAGTVTMAGAQGATRLSQRDWTNLASGIVNLTGTASEISLQGATSTTTVFTNNGAINYSGTTANAWPVAWRSSSAGTSFVNSGSFTKTSSSASKIEVAAVTNSGTLNVDSGSLSVVGGTFTQSGNINLAAATTFVRSGGFTNAGGVLAGSGTIDIGGGANLLTNDGTIRPGGAGAAGGLNLTGSVTFGAGGALEIDLAGTSPLTQHDQFNVTGTAVTLGGNLNVIELAGYKARFSDGTYVVLNNTGTVGGSFAAINATVAGGAATFGAANTGTTAGINLTSGTTSYIATGASNWNIGGNWDRGTPTANADAIIDLGSGPNTITINTAESARSLTVTSPGGGANINTVAMTGGSLALAQNSSLDANSVLSLTGGSLGGAGSLTANGAVTLGGTSFTGAGTLTTSGVTTLNGSPAFNGVVTWNNSGTVDIGGANRILMYNGAVLNNLAGGIINDTTTAASPLEGNGTPSTFVNAGSFNKNAGSAATQSFSINAFANSGSFNVNAGSFQLTSSGTDTGTYAIGATTTLAVTAGTRSFNGTSFSGSGVLGLTGGTMDFATNTTFLAGGPTLSLTGGTVSGIGNLTVNSALTLGGTTFNGVGGGSFNTSGTTTLNGSPAFNGVVTWNNSGTVDIGGANRILMYNGAVLNNLAGGIINDTTTAASPLEGNGTPSTFVNAGSFNKNAGSAATQSFSINAFANSGSFNVNAGSFQLTSSGTDTGTYAIGATTTLAVTAGTRSFNGTSFSGSGVLGLTGGTMDFATNTTFLAGGPTLSLTGGTVSGIGNLTVNSALTLGGTTFNGVGGGSFNTSGTTTLNGSPAFNGVVTWNNSGTVDIGGANRILMYNGAVLNNLAGGIINDTTTAASPLEGNGTPSTFVNAGSFNKNAGSAATQSFSINAFANSGSFNVNAGSFQLTSSGTDTGTYAIGATTTLAVTAGTRSFNGTSFTGSGALGLTGGTMDFATSTTFLAGGPTLSLTGGIVSGVGNLTVNNALTLGGTTFNGAGGGSFNTSGTTTLNGSPSFNGAVTWNNSGTVDIGGGDRILMYNGAVLNNLAGGIINDTTTAASPLEGNGTPSTFVNAGSFNKNAGSAATQSFSINAFANSGSFNVNAGSFQLTSSGTDTGTYAIGATTTLAVTAGTRSFNGTSFTGSGALGLTGGTMDFATSTTFLAGGPTLSLTGGIVSGVGNLTVNNALTLGGTTFNGAGGGSFNTSGTTTLNGSPSFNGAVTWNNSGTVDIGGGDRILMYNGAVLNNLAGGIINDTTTAASPLEGNGTPSTFVNAGNFNKNAGSAATQTFSVNAFANSGSFNVNAGSFQASGSANEAGIINVASGASFEKAAGFTNTGTLSGAGTISVGGNVLTNNGTISPGVGAGNTATLSITGNLLLGGSSVVEADIGGTTAGSQYDQISLSGNLTLGGDIRYQAVGGFTGGSGNSFALINPAGTNSGTANVTTLASNPAFVFGSTTASGTLTIAGLMNFWTLAGDGNWSTGANWSRGVKPDSTVDAVIDQAGGAYTVTVNTAEAAKSLKMSGDETLSITAGSLDLAQASDIGAAATMNLSGGTLQGAGNLTINGSMTWSGGTQATNTGTTTIAAGASLNITGPVSLSRRIDNFGTTTWSGVGN
ncbi:filamentous hemagglutinin N-terminal domain-containing protein, partial [Sulfuritalea sp.]|uniref:beta strand repeat-containing protein n=1 Tax=Sulfuritalea sp. TaxID=2480090 RepID=UPI00286DFC49